MSREDIEITVRYFPASNCFVVSYGLQGSVFNTFESVTKFLKEKFGIMDGAK
ncbi:MAG: hypothetical protein AB7F25_06845 [Deferribacterales bacterium]